MTKPLNIQKVVKLAQTEIAAGKTFEAEKRLVAALSGGADNPLLLVTLADFYRIEGKYIKARQLYEKAHLLDATSDYILVNLGIVYGELGTHEKAKNAFDLAIQRNPNNAEAYNNCGSSLSILGEFEKAKIYFEQAIKINPDYTKPLLNIGVLVRYTADDEYTKRLISFLEREESLSLSNRINLHFALGKCFEDLGRYEESMMHYVTGNDLKSASLNYSVNEVLEKMAGRISVISAGSWVNENSVGSTSTVPIFVLGMPRSGTSLVEQVLASHSHVYGAGELVILDRALAGLRVHEDIIPIDPNLRRQYEDDFKARGEFYVKQARALAPNARRIVDKLPMNFLHIGLIHLILPNAKIIHCRRHPIDTCLSNFKTNFSEKMEWSYNLESVGEYYLGYSRMMDHWEKILPGKILSVDYEDMVSDLENQSRRLIEYCGLEWEEACLNFHETKRSVYTASVAQVRQKIYSTSVGKWEKYGRTIQPLIDTLKPVFAD